MDLDQCIALSLALIYYFRLPTKEDNEKRGDVTTPSREELAGLLSKSLPRFERRVQQQLEKFVNTKNFSIPAGVAINQAVCIRSVFVITISSLISSIQDSRTYFRYYCQYHDADTAVYNWCTRLVQSLFI